MLDYGLCLNSVIEIGCTRLRAVSGILRTQRGRRGSRLGRLLAGTAGAGPALCGRVPASSTPRVRLRRPRPAGQLFAATPIAPVAHLWPASGTATSHWSWVSSRTARRGAGSPARIATVVFAAACSGAGSGRHLRTQIADSTVYLGGPATVGAGPLMCADSWAVTLWRIANAARLRRSRGHRVERGQPVLSARHRCGCSLGQVGVQAVPACSRPGRERCPNCSVPRARASARRGG
jgi:hypothetical protein